MKTYLLILLTFFSFQLSSYSYRFDERKDLIIGIENNVKKISKNVDDIIENKSNTSFLRNKFVLDVLKKDENINQMNSILSDFLKKYINENNPNFLEKLTSIQRMFSLAYKIKNDPKKEYADQLKDEFFSFKKMMRLNYRNKYRKFKECE